MPLYTTDELKKIEELRDQQHADQAIIGKGWDVAGVGYSQGDTEYRIEYRLKGNGTAWYSAHPFYEPLSPHADYTTDQQRADEIADLILAGQWPTTRGGDPQDRNIVAVRVVEVVSTSKITKQRHREES